MTAPKTVAIVLGRSGSKDIPDKNRLDFAGKRILAWSILQARKRQLSERVLLEDGSLQTASVSREDVDHMAF